MLKQYLNNLQKQLIKAMQEKRVIINTLPGYCLEFELY